MIFFEIFKQCALVKKKIGVDSFDNLALVVVDLFGKSCFISKTQLITNGIRVLCYDFD